MSIRTTSLLRIAASAAAVALAVYSGSVVGRDRPVTVAIAVSAQGLDLSQPAAAHKFYAQVANAAWMACTDGNRVGLAPVADVRGCYEDALARAIRSAQVRLLTQIYLETHTFREALARGVVEPSQVAAK